MSDCIEWTGYRNEHGYGRYRVADGRRLYAHRFAWEQVHGPIPEGMCICHHCDNPPCINVEHLFLGTHLDNNRDMVAKGRLHTLRGEASPTARLTQVQVDEIRALYGAGNVMQAELGRRFGISNQHVSRIVLGRAWPLTLSN